MILSTAAIYSWNMRSKMDVRDYFIQKWQIYSKWYASSSCFSLPRVCAEEDRGSIAGSAGKVPWLIPHASWRPLGLVLSHLSLILFPRWYRWEKLMLWDLRVARRHTAWCWQSHSEFSPLLALYLVLLALPWSFSWNPHGKPAKWLLLLESLSDLVSLSHIKYSCHLSKVLWRRMRCEMLACNGQWDLSVKVFVEELLRGTCHKWWISTEFDLGTGWATSQMVKKEPEPAQHLGTGWR